MRPPSENLRSMLSTFHSTSVGGRLVGLLKKISYSIFRRRSCVSSTVSSSSSVTGFLHDQCREVKYRAARYLWVTEGYGTKVSCQVSYGPRASSCELSNSMWACYLVIAR